MSKQCQCGTHCKECGKLAGSRVTCKTCKPKRKVNKFGRFFICLIIIAVLLFIADMAFGSRTVKCIGDSKQIKLEGKVKQKLVKGSSIRLEGKGSKQKLKKGKKK